MLRVNNIRICRAANGPGIRQLEYEHPYVHKTGRITDRSRRCDVWLTVPIEDIKIKRYKGLLHVQSRTWAWVSCRVGSGGRRLRGTGPFAWTTRRRDEHTDWSEIDQRQEVGSIMTVVGSQARALYFVFWPNYEAFSLLVGLATVSSSPGLVFGAWGTGHPLTLTIVTRKL